jgi:hypothetical protein
MHASSLPVILGGLLLVACGSSTETTPSSSTKEPAATFAPGPVAEGYTRLTSPTVANIPPGGDVTFCQYVMAPFDHDVDVLDVKGVQSKFGHHAAAFTFTDNGTQTLGSSLQCMGTEFTAGAVGTDSPSAPSGASALASMGAYLGGVGGDTTTAKTTALPAGVAFRLKKGSGIMLNVHYLNTGEQTIDGNSVIDMKFADADPSRTIASMFVNLNAGFSLSPDAQTSSTIDCVAQGDLNIIMMSNHMHEFGTSAKTELLPAGSTTPQVMHEDTTWTFDMQFNPAYSQWDVAAPLTIHAGDTIRTTCNWDNTTADTMTFPREMCLGVGFAIAPSGTASVPMCVQGSWIAQGI